MGCSPWGREQSDTTEWLRFHFSLSCIGEGNGSPLQCSCLENPRDRGAWWAAIYGVAQSRTRLKRLSSSSPLGVTVCCSPTGMGWWGSPAPSTVQGQPPFVLWCGIFNTLPGRLLQMEKRENAQIRKWDVHHICPHCTVQIFTPD